MRDKAITIGGTVYRLAVPVASEVDELLAYSKAVLPDPVQEVLRRADQLPEKVRERYLDKNLDAAFTKQNLRGTFADPDFEPFLHTEKGYTKLFGLMFKRHHPGMTDEGATALVIKAIEEGNQDVFVELWQSAVKYPVSEEEVENNFFRAGGDTSGEPTGADNVVKTRQRSGPKTRNTR